MSQSHLVLDFPVDDPANAKALAGAPSTIVPITSGPASHGSSCCGKTL